MPITRKFVAQNQEECQVLRMDNIDPFVVNHGEEWQFLFGPNSALTTSNLGIKISAQFNTTSFDGIKLIAYLYEAQTGQIAALGTCSFYMYKVTSSTWQDQFINSFTGSILPNSYFYKALTAGDLGGLDLDGETTIMVEAVGTRLGSVYRDRIYVNHLGIYDSVIRLRHDVEYLNITKLDE